MTMTDPTTAAEPIVIFPAVTCPADMPQRCEDIAMALLDLSPALRELLIESRKLGEMFNAIAVDHVDLDNEETRDHFYIETGYGTLRPILRSLIDELEYAICDTYRVPPMWLTPEERRAAVQKDDQ